MTEKLPTERNIHEALVVLGNLAWRIERGDRK